MLNATRSPGTMLNSKPMAGSRRRSENSCGKVKQCHSWELELINVLGDGHEKAFLNMHNNIVNIYLWHSKAIVLETIINKLSTSLMSFQSFDVEIEYYINVCE